MTAHGARDEAYRETRYGAISGKLAGDSALVWYGVPYASPPVGERRWRAPTPPAPWQGVRDATHPAEPACQTLSFSTPDGRAREGRIVGDEDCLYLTIWSPRFSTPEGFAAERLPVLVWFHGGGNMIGDGADFDASRLSASQNVIVVSINYRLNILGWFAHRALRDPGADAEEHSGNFAILDHLAALRWVHENIAAFGGDPARVTLFGHFGRRLERTWAALLTPGARPFPGRNRAKRRCLPAHELGTCRKFPSRQNAGAPSEQQRNPAHALA